MTERWGWQPLAWEQNGLPSWTWRNAPAGLVTRRQMRVVGLAPGGAEPVGQIVYCRGRREARALLWDRTDLVAKRVPSAAQLHALGKAMAARRWCPACERDVGYCVPTSLGMCVDCAYPDTVWMVDETPLIAPAVPPSSWAQALDRDRHGVTVIEVFQAPVTR